MRHGSLLRASGNRPQYRPRKSEAWLYARSHAARLRARRFACSFLPHRFRKTTQSSFSFGSHSLARENLSSQCAPGGLLPVASLRATTVPTAAATPIIAPTLITSVRTRRCLAGAIAAPAGCDAAMPLVSGASAVAVPTGFCGAACGGELVLLLCSAATAGTPSCCCAGASIFANVAPGLSGRSASAAEFDARLLDVSVCWAAARDTAPGSESAHTQPNAKCRNCFFQVCIATPGAQYKLSNWLLLLPTGNFPSTTEASVVFRARQRRENSASPLRLCRRFQTDGPLASARESRRMPAKPPPVLRLHRVSSLLQCNAKESLFPHCQRAATGSNPKQCADDRSQAAVVSLEKMPGPQGC